MKYLVEGGIAHIGTDMVLKLTREQAEARAFALETVRPGFYRPKMPVQFKAGETIEIDVAHDALPRTLGSVLAPQGGKGGKGGKAKETDGEAAGAAAGVTA